MTMTVEGSGRYVVFNSTRRFYFSTFDEIGRFLGVHWDKVRIALHNGSEINGYCIDIRLPERSLREKGEK